MIRKLFGGLLACVLFWAGVTTAQPYPGGPIPAPYPGGGPLIPGAIPAPWGRCDLHTGQSYAVEQNGHTYQIGNPGNQGFAMPDASGMTFLRMPAANPMADAFFVTWNLDVVQISTYLPGPRLIGRCVFQVMPAPPPAPVFNTAIAPNVGVVYAASPNGFIPVPQMVANRTIGFSPPGLTTADVAQQCMNRSGNQAEFADCMIPKMMSPTQRAAYDCTKRYGNDKMLLASCLAQPMVGHNEQRALEQATRCYQQFGSDYSKYPLCMANQNFDPKTAAAVNCMADRAKSGSISAWSVAGCAAGAQLNMNAETSIAVQCAMSTGGQPYAFAACAGGQLTANELQKCFTVGIGGNGCFGDGNTIVQGLRSLGVNMQSVLNPNGAVIHAYNTAVNDIRNGPGANNDVVRAINTINNDLTHGMGKNNDIRKTAEKLGLGGLF